MAVDQHEIADRLGAGLDLERAHDHGGARPDGEQDRVRRIGHRKRRDRPDARVLVARHRFIVTFDLAILVAEIFHRLVIDQRIDRLELASVSPRSSSGGYRAGTRWRDKCTRLDSDGRQDHRDVAPVELPHHVRRQSAVSSIKVGESCSATSRTMVSMPLRPRSSTRLRPPDLALEMEAQRQLVQMREGAHRKPAHRVHRHLAEQAVAQLRKRRHQDAHAAISNHHGDRHGQQPRQPVVAAAGAVPWPASASVAH